MKINLVPFLAILASTFYTHPAKANVVASVEAAISLELHTNPKLSRDAAITFATTNAESLADKALKHVAPWAVPYVDPILVAEIPALAGAAYDKIDKAINPKSAAAS